MGREAGNPNVDYGEAHDSVVGSCNFMWKNHEGGDSKWNEKSNTGSVHVFRKRAGVANPRHWRETAAA